MNGLIRWVRTFIRDRLRPIIRHFYIVDRIFPEEAARDGNADVQNLRVLLPAERIQFTTPSQDPFTSVGRYFSEGWFDRPNVFVCDMPEAFLYVDTGMVCTRHWKVAADFDVRLTFFKPFGKRRPRKITRLAGTYSSIGYGLDYNPYHWMVDCLPKLISLARAEPEAKIKIIMSDTLGEQQRETLEAIMPAHFELHYYPADTWLHLERFIWPSLVSGAGNGFLPADYYEAIRQPIFKRYQLASEPAGRERIYITRRDSKRRRVLNEDAVEAFLGNYGFKLVELSKLSFRAQVELFHCAEIIVAPHGAGLNVLFFCGKIPIVVLHPNQTPQNHFHTLARGLGQDYRFILHHGDIDSDFDVDLPALKHVLEEDLKLRPTGVT